MKVSVIMLSLNFGDYIEESIKAILNQDYPNFELVVIDGGSKDGTTEILKKYGEKIIWLSEPDSGQGDAIRKGIAISSGDILTLQAADDLLYPGAITRAVTEIGQHPEAAGVYGGYTYIDYMGRTISGTGIANSLKDQERLEQQGKVTSNRASLRRAVGRNLASILRYLYRLGENAIRLFLREKKNEYSLEKLITREIVLPTCSVFFRRKMLEKISLERLGELSICPDYYLWLGMAIQAPFVPVSGNFCRVRKQLGGANINPQNIDRLQQANRITAEWFFNNPAVPVKYKTRSIRRKLHLMILLRRPGTWSYVSEKKAILEYLKILKSNPDIIFYWPQYFKSFLGLPIIHYLHDGGAA